MIPTIHWSTIQDDSDPLWDLSRGLYAYLAPDGKEILYIGKVDGTTIRERWNRPAKENFWDDLERERHIRKHIVIGGEIELNAGDRLTRELLADIESLLIAEVDTWGNIQSRNSRISRPGLRLRCLGNWPLKKRELYDVG